MSDSGTPVNGERIDASDVTSSLVPAGVIFPYGGSSAPTGYVLCNGSAISRTTYATLFGVVGTSFGSGDGSTTFNVPDMRERVPVGKGTVTGFTAVGTSDGVTEASRAVSHTHTGPSHTHAQNMGTSPTNTGSASQLVYATSGSAAGAGTNWSGSGTNIYQVQTGVVAGGTGATGATAEPYMVVNYIIKT